MIEIGIVGSKNAGKTTLIEELTKQLKSMGHKIATIKHTSHRHSFDKPGKDTDRHRQAGAEMTLAISETSFALFGNSGEKFPDKLKEVMHDYFDICLIEGNKQSLTPKIIITRNIEKLGNPLPENIIASFGHESLKDDITHFGENDISGLAHFILDHFSMTTRGADNA